MCKATIKGMTFAEQHVALQRVDQEETRRIEAEGLDEDTSLEGMDDLARPTDAGKGHMAVWAVFKLMSLDFSTV
eukprot:COSAG01_NODE_2187_length_8196_cov_76.436458_2_plen_74_part_00